ncbi:MAG: hypothetical protein FWF80_08100 [Defluviitaleaceae bacterium]|nr:hypothetical protein [Defluviitaleaceae bacterium]
MSEEMKQRQEKILNVYPFFAEIFEDMCATRRREITEKLPELDAHYKALARQRADTSQVVLKILIEHGMVDHFEAYSDAICEEEIYELDAIYREAFLDALEFIATHQLKREYLC